MSLRTQLLIVTTVIVASFAITKLISISQSSRSAFEGTATSTAEDTGTIPAHTPQDTRKLPTRKMDVLDPQVDAQSVLIQDLDLDYPLFNYQTNKQWPMASLTKLMTAVVITENVGLTKTIPITKEALETEGIAGDLKSGETYTSEDLMKIMLMVSSNRAAAAFEQYEGGKEAFAVMLNKKAQDLGMTNTVFYDGSGLSPKNESTTSDLLKLAKYLIDKHPEIIGWTRLQTIKVQPTNSTVSRSVNNIDIFSSDASFLGGKTGTTPEARENLLALFSFNNDRIIYILLGSHDRTEQTNKLLKWIKEAYIYN